MRTRDSQRRRTSGRRDDPTVVAAILDGLAGAVGAPRESSSFRIERSRLAARSAIYFIRSERPFDGRSRWVAKVPDTGWSQEDLAAPVSAATEYAALCRLHAHLDGDLAVPDPVVHLPEVGALVMAFVPGLTVRELLNYGALLHPAPLVRGMSAAGRFLARLHQLDRLPAGRANLRAHAGQVLRVEEELLAPRGLQLPELLREVLAAVPDVIEPTRTVTLHGDFGPGNVLLGSDGSTVGLDAALDRTGAPELDLARFAVLVSTSVRWAPELLVAPAGRARHALLGRLQRSYYGSTPVPTLFELVQVELLARRWVRLCELAERTQRPALLPARLRLVRSQVHVLMLESAQRLITRELP
jgi:aminoglycoside phosphotransferase (APT) family kinase protein